MLFQKGAAGLRLGAEPPTHAATLPLGGMVMWKTRRMMREWWDLGQPPQHFFLIFLAFCINAELFLPAFRRVGY